MTQSNVALGIAPQMKGAQLQSKDSFLYGKFETMVKPGNSGSAAVAGSFFTFYDGGDYKTNWNEIGFEPLGRNTNTIDAYTITGKKTVNNKQTVLGKRTSDKFWKLSIDWNPDRVIWSVDDATIRVLPIQIRQAQKIMMNVWVSDDKNWAGEFHPGMLPSQAEYLYVRYTSLDGRSWQDDFTSGIDQNRWQKADWNLGRTILVPENVNVVEGNLVLKLT